MKVKKSKKIRSNKPESGSIEAKIKPVDKMPVMLKTLIYGRSGTGKTHLVGTAPKPLLLLDVKETGYTTIMGQKGVDVMPIQEWMDLEEVYWYLVKHSDKYKTVAIDTITGLQDLAVKQIIGGRASRISRGTWNEISSLMKTWILNFRDLPMNVIFTAQDRITGGDDEDVTDDDNVLMPEVGPYAMPSVAKVLNACVGVIGQTYIREQEIKIKKASGKTRKKLEVQYCMRIGPHARFVTKFRSDPVFNLDIPSVLVDPTFDKLYHLTTNEKKEE